MSSRALKKLQSKKLENQEIVAAPEANDAEEQIAQDVPKNRFEMLNSDEGENASVFQNNHSTANSHAATTGSGARPKQPKSSKSKKHRNKKTGQKNDIDEIDLLVKQIEDNSAVGQDQTMGTSHIQSSKAHSNSDGLAASTIPSETELFTVETRNLNPDVELKKKFGSAVTALGGSKRNIRRVQHNQWGGRFASKLVQPKSQWPPVGKTGLSMKLIESNSNLSKSATANEILEFSFEHGPTYQNAQIAFWDAVESGQPDLLMAILHEFPFHVDTLMQLSEVVRHNEDFQMARDLIERGLYACESIFHPKFNITQNCCRLDYSQAENRPFFLALFRHMTGLAQRGCYRTALEFAKLIYSLSPQDDPLGILLLIDFYALRSGEFEYLQNLFYGIEATKNVSQLPNFSFSVALAAKNFSEFGGFGDSPEIRANADELLQTAILKFPTFLRPILDRCSVEPDKQVESCSLFSSAEQANDAPGLSQLIGLYVARTHLLWKELPIMRWLESNVRAVIGDLENRKETVDKWRIIRKTRFAGRMPQNILRHIFLSEIRDPALSMPIELRDQTILNYDPLPPPNSRRNYEKPERPAARISDSYLQSFLHSILPNFNPETDLIVPEEAEAAEGAAAAPRGAEFQDSVHRLLNAMRDLLGNLEPPAVPNENAAENEDNDDEWDNFD